MRVSSRRQGGFDTNVDLSGLAVFVSSLSDSPARILLRPLLGRYPCAFPLRTGYMWKQGRATNVRPFACTFF